MNYQKIYDSIIKDAKSKDRKKLRKNNVDYIYYENHHIIPKCLNGTNDIENLVLLTAKEHFMCHKLLTYIYKGDRKLACAFHRMTYTKNKRISLRDYVYAKELQQSIPVSIETKKKQSKARKGVKFSESHKDNLRKSIQKIKNEASLEEKNRRHEYAKGDKNGMFGKISPNKGKKLSIEEIENIKICTKLAMQRPEVKHKQKQNKLPMFAEKNGMYQQHHSDESKEKISLNLLKTPKIKCIHCLNEFYPWHYSRSHGDKCKKINVII